MSYISCAMNEHRRLLTLRMLAQRFRSYGLTIAWLKAEAEAGRIPCFRAGRRLLFDAAAVEQALIERARHGNGGHDAR